MIAPDPEQWRLLSRTERVGLRLAEFCVRRLPRLSVAVSYFPMGALVWAGIGRRLRLRGLEHVQGMPADSSLLLVANHRSFFDFFTIAVALRLKARLRHRMYFPVRSEFFYDSPLGLLVNLVGAGMSMFPPIFRSGAKRSLNRWSLCRCARELARPGTAVGFHPEGTRGTNGDPFFVRPFRSGPARVALAVPGVRVIPVCVAGLGNAIPAEIWRNLVAPGKRPVWMAFGPEVDLSDLRGRADRAAARQAAERCRAAIQALADVVRAEAAGRAA